MPSSVDCANTFRYTMTSSGGLASPFRSDCLIGKVALVTGGGSGIGYEISRQIGELVAYMSCAQCKVSLSQGGLDGSWARVGLLYLRCNAIDYLLP